MANKKLIFEIFLLLIAVQDLQAAIIRRSADTTISADEAKIEFERLAATETETFLNNMYKNQIDFFTKVKQELPNTKRAQDITLYVQELEKVIQEKNLDEKNKMWRDVFREFSRSPLMVNKEEHTGVSDERYQEILEKSGLEESVQQFIVEVATYFWKMAKASGKVIEATIDEYIERLKKESTLWNLI